ncbi:uncharacterized protein (DUF924 family) [Roseibium hamelinense]|uniref:Uncharacterized protein (DUF924 family) n=1 Tax=Roseibium hamelinense TaxID=150831 RepID=A0A562SKP1_9HYPH|nr:DUF924 family protein [Roseibium hamelinense]MTI43410.1 DUF924 domain-containing protein [Roseibium hamelinense]TWI81867.1 uncharacterized protein (DUF924 family) [Roseibium hamelinense]
MSASVATPLEVLDFWWQAGAEKWFAGGAKFDQECRDGFLPTIESAQRGDLNAWQEMPHGALALILVLDQLTRNVFRGSARAFEADARAFDVATHAVERGFDQAFPRDVRVFFYLPFEHAEDMAAQEKSVDLCRRLGIEQFYHYALIHMDVIRRFGRFPHRNEVLGRESTEQERAYLADHGFSA